MPILPYGDRVILQEAADRGSLMAVTRVGGIINTDGQQRLRELMVLAACGYLYKDAERAGEPGDWIHVYKLTEDGRAALRNH